MAQVSRNPFTPNFGSVPVWMAGRSRLIQSLNDALDRGVGDPNLCTLVWGARGSGKTALLAYMSGHASDHGWISADTSCAEGMLEDIVQRTLESARGLVKPESAHITSVGVASLANVSWERQQSFEPNWRTRMNAILDQLDASGVGLLITVDEVKPTVPEMVHLVSVYQHFVREKRKVALLMAGPPHDVSGLLSDEDVSFLRRAAQHHLGNVNLTEARIGLRRTIEYGGRSIEPDALDRAADATLGYPYLMQLVGFYVWEVGMPSPLIASDDVADGIALARSDFESRVLNATYRTLSDGDIRFLEAMVPDEAESRIADIAQRMGVTSSYASHYRRRLEEQGIVSTVRRGVVRVDLPLLKDYVARMA